MCKNECLHSSLRAVLLGTVECRPVHLTAMFNQISGHIATGFCASAHTTLSVPVPVPDHSAPCQLPVAGASSRCKLPVASASSRCQLPVASASSRCQVPVADVSSRCQFPVPVASCRVPDASARASYWCQHQCAKFTPNMD